MLHSLPLRTPLPVLAEKAARATRMTRPLLDDFASGSDRLQLLQSLGKAERYEAFVASGAYTEAALELLAIDLPGWSVRRLCHEDAEWLCTLACYADAPDWLDGAVEASHRLLPVAILLALAEARSHEHSAGPSWPLPGAGESLGSVGDCANYR